MRTPAPPPDLEAIFALQLRATGMPPHVTEYVFHPVRKWRFDFCWIDLKVAVEIDGGTGILRGKHVRPEGFRNDCIKLNEAALHGWLVLRGDSQMVKNGSLLAMAERAVRRESDGSADGIRLRPGRLDRTDGRLERTASPEKKGTAGKGKGPEEGITAAMGKVDQGKRAKKEKAEGA